MIDINTWISEHIEAPKALFFLAYVNIGLDYTLSTIALADGFFETNPFSVKFGLGIHALILFGMLTFASWWWVEYPHHRSLWVVFITTFNIIWSINNILSMLYIGDIL